MCSSFLSVSNFRGKDGVRVNGRVIKDKSAGGKYEWDFDISPLDGFAHNNNNFRLERD